MFELIVYTLASISLIILMLYAAYSHICHLRQTKYWQFELPHPRTLNKTLWETLKFTWTAVNLKKTDLLPYVEKMFQDYGSVFHVSLVGRSYVFLNDPDDIKILLSSRQHITKGPEYDMLKPWLNEGTIVSSDLKWHNRRKLLTKTFHFKYLDMYNYSMNKHSQVLSKKLLEASTNHKEINITKYMALCSLDISCESIMGTEINAQQGKSEEYVSSISSACEAVVNRIYKFWYWSDLIFGFSNCGRIFFKSIKVLHNYTDHVIKSKRILLNKLNNLNGVPDKNEYNINQKSLNKSFLDLLLEKSAEYPEQLTDKDIREEVDTFLFASHDTTSITTAISVILLGIHQDIQDRARAEVLSVLNGVDRNVTSEDLGSLKYLEAVIKESLRLYPSVPAISRKLKTVLNITKHSIPPETIVAVFPFILHRNESIYPNPEKFIPERFLDEENKSKFLFGYLPFSAGPRNCMGQKYAMNLIKIVLSTILKNMRIETLGTMDDIKISPQLTIKIESIPELRFHKI